MPPARSPVSCRISVATYTAPSTHAGMPKKNRTFGYSAMKTKQHDQLDRCARPPGSRSSSRADEPGDDDDHQQVPGELGAADLLFELASRSTTGRRCDTTTQISWPVEAVGQRPGDAPATPAPLRTSCRASGTAPRNSCVWARARRRTPTRRTRMHQSTVEPMSSVPTRNHGSFGPRRLGSEYGERRASPPRYRTAVEVAGIGAAAQ